MKSYDIAVIPGDGVGKEVSREARKILIASAKKYGFGIKTEDFKWGCDYYLENGKMNPENMLDILSDFDAIFLGCVGDESKVPDHVSLTLLLDIRYGFDQYVNLRPIKLYPGVESPIKTATPETVDMVVIRENSEGEYSRAGGFLSQELPMHLLYKLACLLEKAVNASFAMPSISPANGKSWETPTRSVW